MGIPITIGAPPKSMLSKPGWRDRRDSYLKLNITPYSIGAKNFNDMLESFADGTPPFNVDFKSMIFRASKLGCSYPENTDVGQVIVYALQEGAISETYGNNIGPDAVTGWLDRNLAESGIASVLRTMHNNFGTDIGQGVGAFAKQVGETFGIDSLKRIDPNEWSSAFKGVGSDKTRNLIAQKMHESGFDPGLSTTATKYLQTGINILLGKRPIYPFLWENSSSSANYSFRVRLYNPNPCSLKLHQKCIVDGLAILKALALPSTISTSKTKEELNNSTTYGPPLYVGAESKGLFRVKYAMIENMSVVYGGDENSIAFNGRPNYVDVSFALKPVYPIKVITDNLSLDQCPANDYISMNALQDNNEETIVEKNEDVNEEGVENGGEVTTPQNQSDTPALRVDKKSQDINGKLTK